MRDSIQRVIIHGAVVTILLAVAGRAEAALTIMSPFSASGIALDGVLDAAYGPPSALAVFDDAGNPGVYYTGGGLEPIGNSTDLSYRIFSAHTATHLFIAFEVTDDFLDLSLSPAVAYFNDSVEVFIDGDQVDNDYDGQNDATPGNREGFQLVADPLAPSTPGNHKETAAGGEIVNTDWSVGALVTATGYIIEFGIPLALIDTIDGAADSAPAVSGATLGFNAAVTDNDADVDDQRSYGMFWNDDPGTRLVDFESEWEIDLQMPAIPEPSAGLIFAGLAGCVGVGFSWSRSGRRPAS